VPAGWQKKPDAARSWIVTALSWSKALPAKGAKGAKAARATKAKPAAKRAAKRVR